MVVLEGIGNTQNRGGCDLDPAAFIADANGIWDGDDATRRRLLSLAGRGKQGHEWFGTAIERRDLAAIHLDFEIIDAKARCRRHQMLDGLDASPVSTDGCRVVGVADALRRRGYPFRVPGYPE